MANNEVMISYSRKDKAFIQRLDAALRKQGIDPWIDWEDIPPTVDWMRQIEQGIEGANTIIFVISPDSVESEICAAEIEYADTHHKRMIPILYREVELKTDANRRRSRSSNPLESAYAALGIETQSAKLLQRFTSHNWIFFREEDDFDTALNTLLEALRTDYDYVEEHTRLFIRAREWEQKGRSRWVLLTGGELRDAEKWLIDAQEKKPKPTALHVEYISASRQNQSRRLTLLLAGFVVGFVGMLAFAVFAYLQYQEADTQRLLAESAVAEANQQALIANAQLAAANSNPDLALALILEANRKPNIQSELVLAEIAYAPAARRIFSPGASAAWGSAISPDGRYALAGLGRSSPLESPANDNRLLLWNLQTGTLVREFVGHQDAANIIVFHPDSKRAYSSSWDGFIIEWDINSGRELRRFADDAMRPHGIAVSPDGKLLLAAGGVFSQATGDTAIRLWDLDSGVLLKKFDDGQGYVFRLAFSPDGKTFVSTSGNFFTDSSNVIRLWDVESGDLLHRLEGHTAFVLAVAFSPDGRFVLSGSGNPLTGTADNTLRLWNVSTGAEVYRVQHGNPVSDVAFDPSGQTFVSASLGGEVRLWKADTGQFLSSLAGHTNWVLDVEFLPDGSGLLSNSSDNTLRLWALENGAELQRLTEHRSGAYAALFVPSQTEGGDLLTVSGSSGGRLILSDVASAEVLSIRQLSQAVTMLEASTDGRYLLSARGLGEETNNHVITLWEVRGDDIAPLRQFGENSTGHPDTITGLAFAPDNQTFASIAGDGVPLIWDIESGAILHKLDNGHDSFGAAVVYSPDGRYLFSAAWDGLIIKWDVASGEPLQQYTNGDFQVRIIDLSPDGKWLISGGEDAIIYIWDVASGAIVRRFVGHTSLVTAVAFNHDASQIASGSFDNNVILWDVASGEAIRRFSGHSDLIRTVSFSPDGRLLITASFDQTVRIWAVQQLSELINWTCQNRVVRPLSATERERFRIAQLGSPLCVAR